MTKKYHLLITLLLSFFSTCFAHNIPNLPIKEMITKAEHIVLATSVDSDLWPEKTHSITLQGKEFNYGEMVKYSKLIVAYTIKGKATDNIIYQT